MVSKDGQQQTLEDIEAGQRIRVVESGIPGDNSWHLQLNSKVEHAPEDVYGLLTDPTAGDYFRSIKECTKRVVLEEDEDRKHRIIDITHKAVARFMFISVTFTTELIVEEDDVEKTIHFRTARKGFMEKFEGSWHVRPFCQRSLTAALKDTEASNLGRGRSNSGFSLAHSKAHSSAGHPWLQQPSWLNAAAVVSAFQRLTEDPHPKTSLVSLEQQIVPRAPSVPGVVRGLVCGLCAKQLKDMMEDLNKELERRAVAKTSNSMHASSSLTSVDHQHMRRMSPLASTTASSITLAQPLNLWQQVTPLINIQIDL